MKFDMDGTFGEWIARIVFALLLLYGIFGGLVCLMDPIRG